jgi:hypothetical protein
MKIKLSSKRLHSGKCQVRFQVAEDKSGASWYGYALAEPQETLKEVVERIENRFLAQDHQFSFPQRMLSNLGAAIVREDKMMIFREGK